MGGTAGGGPVGDLLERSGELGKLAGALSAVTSAGHGHVVLAAGDAGIGKTALLRQFTGSVPAAVRVLWARCEPLFTPRPLGPVIELAAVIGTEPAARAIEGHTPYDVAAALFAELATVPTVVVFDDVHWADEATLDVIRLFARRIADAAVLLVLTYRDDELDRAHPLRIVLGDLPGRAQVTRLTLAGLSPAAVAELAATAEASEAAAGTARSRIDPAALHRRTGGNPFYVSEVLATGADSVPGSVRDAVLARVLRLSPAARRLLDAASVVPGPAGPWLLEALASGSTNALDECLGSGIVVIAGDQVEFRHEIARQVVEESLAPGQRLALHRGALAALAAPTAGRPDLARLAHHADAAGDADAVLTFAPAAAEAAAAAGAWREAARLCARALMFGDQLTPERHAALLEQFAAAAFYTELGRDAAAALRTAVSIHARRGDVVRHGDALRRLGNQLGRDGAVAESAAVIAEAVTLLETQPPGRELARAYNSMAAVTGIAEDEAAVLWGKKAIAVAEQVGSLDAAGDALGILATAELRSGDLGGLEKLDQSRVIAESAGDVYGVASAYARAAAALGGRREWALAERYIRDGRQFCGDRGIVPAYGWLTTLAAQEALARGRWDEAERTAAEILSWPPGFASLRATALVVTATVRVRRGEAGHQQLLDDAARLAQAIPASPPPVQVAALRAEVAWLTGDAPPLAAAEQGPGAAIATRWFGGEPEVWRYRAGLDCGDPSELPEPYRLEITGDVDGAARWWLERDCGYDAAMVLACSAEPSRRRHALDMLHGLKAQPAAAVVARQLRLLGEHSVRRGPRPAAATSPAGLTSRESEVLRLLAAGLTNAEIAARLVLSGRTIDNHVSAIFRKLGVPNRAEAAAAAQRRGLVADAG